MPGGYLLSGTVGGTRNVGALNCIFSSTGSFGFWGRREGIDEARMEMDVYNEEKRVAVQIAVGEEPAS
jgi:hypothetical protein